MAIPTTLREEIKYVLDPENKSLFEEIRQCPCCDSNIIELSFTKYGYQHWICMKCCFVFVNPTPKEENLAILYDSNLYKKIRENIEIPRALRGEDYASLSISKKDALAIIDRIAKKNLEGNWLDIGGGIGSFLNLAKKHKQSNLQYHLLEYNSVSATFAKEHYGINVFNSMDEINSKNIKFDVISLIAVLEHISHPKSFLHSVRQLLTDKGILIISIPHCPPSIMKYKQEYAYFLPPYHLSLFSENNIRLLLKSIEYDVKEVWQSGTPAFVFQYLFHLAEKTDSKIPYGAMEKVNYIFSPPLTFKEKVIYTACSIMNILTNPIRQLFMPKTLLNVIAGKNQ